MKTSFTAEDRSLLDRLLTKVLGSLDGAIDFWTIVCIGNLPPDPRAFVLENCERIRSLIVVARLFLAEVGLASKEPNSCLLESLYAGVQRLQDAFLILAQFRTVPLEEVRSATQALTDVYTDLRESVRQLGQSLDLTISYWQGRAPERDEYFQRILGGLFNQLAHERETNDIARSVSSTSM